MNGRSLRIAVTSYYLPSESKIGAGYMAHRLAEAMVALGHEVTMFSPCRKPDGATYGHVAIPLTGRLRTFKWGWKVGRLDLRRFDVVHAHGDNHFRMPWRRPPLVRTMHGSCFSEALHVKGTKERVRMFALGVTEIIGSVTASRTIAVSKNTRRFYPWIQTVIPNGVDLDRFHPGEKEATPTILFVGTYRQRKRGKLLMDVFEREVRPAVPDATLWMVCSDAPSADGVEVLGRLSDDELASLYRRAWVFCLPSSYEGFGVPYIEAMASGTAVVATPNPGAREVLDGGRLGRVVEPADLGSTLVDLLRAEGERACSVEFARHTRASYGWDAIASQYEAQFQRIHDSQRDR